MVSINLQAKTPSFCRYNQTCYIEFKPLIPHLSQIISYRCLSHGRRNRHINQHVICRFHVIIKYRTDSSIPEFGIQSEVMFFSQLPFQIFISHRLRDSPDSMQIKIISIVKISRNSLIRSKTHITRHTIRITQPECIQPPESSCKFLVMNIPPRSDRPEWSKTILRTKG